jgi:hypothetical protein
MPNERQTWPYQGQATSPRALTLTPDGILNSERSLAGRLRMGTAVGVGPGARGALSDGTRGGNTDFGMDSVPRNYDPIGTSDPALGSRFVRRR